MNEDLLVDLSDDNEDTFRGEISSITICRGNQYLGKSNDIEPREGASSLLEDRFYDVKRPEVARAVLKI